VDVNVDVNVAAAALIWRAFESRLCPRLCPPPIWRLVFGKTGDCP